MLQTCQRIKHFYIGFNSNMLLALFTSTPQYWFRCSLDRNYCVCVLCSAFFSSSFFFFPSRVLAFLRDKNHCLCTIHHCSHTKKILKMSPTVLFIYLEIILIQYFQFSVFSFSKNKLYPNGPLEFADNLLFWLIVKQCVWILFLKKLILVLNFQISCWFLFLFLFLFLFFFFFS